jgi:hypothetical protein
MAILDDFEEIGTRHTSRLTNKKDAINHPPDPTKRRQGWPASDRNPGRLRVGTGGRLQIGMHGRLRRNPHQLARPGRLSALSDQFRLLPAHY